MSAISVKNSKSSWNAEAEVKRQVSRLTDGEFLKNHQALVVQYGEKIKVDIIGCELSVNRFGIQKEVATVTDGNREWAVSPTSILWRKI